MTSRFGSVIPDNAELRDFLSGLEFVLPDLLAEQHRWWRFESLGGVVPQVARKAGSREAEVLGLCILMSDQTLTPIQVRMAIAEDADKIDWLECKIGEPGSANGGLRRIPYARLTKELFLLGQRASDIEWGIGVKLVRLRRSQPVRAEAASSVCSRGRPMRSCAAAAEAPTSDGRGNANELSTRNRGSLKLVIERVLTLRLAHPR